jgi:GTP cyclohydrolase I
MDKYMIRHLKDLQSQSDNRGLPLELVGITKLALPLLVPSKNGESKHVNALVSFFTDLPHDNRGTHMSRFVEILYKNRLNHLTLQTLKKIASEAKKKLKAENAYLEVAFTYLIEKQSPISKKYSFVDYECKVISKVNCGDYEQRLIVRVPVLLLCPCSKAISKYNAHNQRAIVTVDADLIDKFWIEDLIKLIEKEGSSEVYPLLKRPDEKYVTEKSYENPKFVEDVVRDIASKLKNIASIRSFNVECESYESIHNHNAYARFTSNGVLNGDKNANS